MLGVVTSDVTRAALVLLFAGLSASSRLARADEVVPAPPIAVSAPPPATPATPVLFDLGVGTYFPLDIGAEATVELPYRILVQADIGWMPSPYSSTIVGVLGDFGALSSFEQNLITAAIQNSFVGRVSLGWRPFEKLGLEVFAGYTILAVGGSVTGADVIDAFLESKGSNDRFTGMANQSVPLSATLHNVQATVDWRFLLFHDKIVLRASLGYLQCVASSVGITATPSRPAGQAAVNKLSSDVEGFLNPYFTEYVKAPIVGLTAAYRF
jgi:hypothetical protein